MTGQSIARKLENELRKETPDATTEVVIREATEFLAHVAPAVRSWYQDRIEQLEARVFNAMFA